MPLYIVAVFLGLTFIMGIYFSRKKTTFREYAIGNKQFGTATLVSTILATAFGGGGLKRTVESTYELGLDWIIIPLSLGISLWIIAKLALRMGPFMQHLSMSETIDSVYGRHPMIIASIVNICTAIFAVTMQINVMSEAIKMCFPSIEPRIITILSTILLIFYSTFGGIRAITYTDILQFITFSIIIPLLAWFMFIQIGKPVTEIVPVLQNYPKFQFNNLFQLNSHLIGIVLIFLSCAVASIEPSIIQRVYMASSLIQARKAFSYAGLFCFPIFFFINLVGIFVFVGAPDLLKENIWEYITTNIPSLFKGFLSISFLAMSMSTADSWLNVSAIMVSHDILKNLHKTKESIDAYKLRIARWATLVIGLLAMLIAFRCKDLVQLLYWTLDCALPIITAPFILAIFGFRGTSRTALIGMATGFFTILAWNKWVAPSTGMDGSFLAMVANGLAMLAAHYLLKQPEGAGWAKPDNELQQMQQARARKRAERKEAIKMAWANRKVTLSKLTPNDAMLRCIGLYMVVTSIMDYWFMQPTSISWPIIQVCIGTLLIASKTFFSKVLPNWLIGLGALIILTVYLPLDLLWHSWYSLDTIFTACLSLAHCAIILATLPLYLGIKVVAATILLMLPTAIQCALPELVVLLPICGAMLLVCSIIIYLKVRLSHATTRILYLENREKLKEAEKVKASLYDAAIMPAASAGQCKGYGAILTKVIQKMEESISFLDQNMPLYKQDFQSIINKLYDWVAYFNRREKAKKHALLQPTKIHVEELIHKVEFTLSQEMSDPPRLLVEKINNMGPLCPYITCDINQIVYLLTQAVLRVGGLAKAPIIRLQLQATALQFKQADPIESHRLLSTHFQATAWAISEVATPSEALPKVKKCYEDRIDLIKPQQQCPPPIDLQEATISTIVTAHYGYKKISMDKKPPTILLVLPTDVTELLKHMTAGLPIDALATEGPISPKEQADSMMALMQFHDYVSKSAYENDPIDLVILSGVLLLLRQRFAHKRHASGKLFYVRAVGISTLVVEWAFHSPKVIYASLLYDLVRHTCLPLSYIKEHYNLGIYAFVWNIVNTDKRQELDHPSLLYVQNRLKEAIKEEHVQLSVLFIKLAERLYDLRHAAGYVHLPEVHHMAQETLAIDIQLANKYLNPEIGAALEEAAKAALAICADNPSDQDHHTVG
ncbi:sodium:solute symporter family transporter [Cardinium endosymbiont of Encarsia pergandiella]|uniref:sodium:solute symporter family transporter n=1 Tax=Cardinium endosymbiont of Encarsia pergandiella TaxID=249402 RepID=UPI00059FAD6B|nr:HD domain-containing protein [Cardinium endosymbiont of Encarsia pergandiella]